jgi:hypothetical protein
MTGHFLRIMPETPSPVNTVTYMRGQMPRVPQDAPTMSSVIFTPLVLRHPAKYIAPAGGKMRMMMAQQ